MRAPPFRIWVGIMIFWTGVLGSVFLTHFQISLLAMIDKSNRNATTPKLPLENNENYGPRYGWSEIEEGQLIAAIFYGYALMSIPGGILTQYIGPSRAILESFILCTTFSCLAVPLTGNNWIPLFVCRFIIGFCSCVIPPSMMGLIAIWAPPKEKVAFTASFMGFVFGTLITPPLTSWVIEEMGWQWSFYGIAVFAVVFCIAWIILISDDPHKNWICPKQEATFIIDSHEGSVEFGWVKPPLLKILTSKPFIALVIGDMGAISLVLLVVVMAPKFYSECLGYGLFTVGILSSLPSIARIISTSTTATVSFFVFARWNVPKKYSRKVMVVCSHIIPGLILMSFLLNFLIRLDNKLIVSQMVMVMFFGAFSVMTTGPNTMDLAPNYASTQTGILGVTESATGFLVPTIASAITKKNNDIKEWSIVFGMMGCFTMLCGIIYIVFGSTELQPWNDKRTDDPENT